MNPQKRRTLGNVPGFMRERNIRAIPSAALAWTAVLENLTAGLFVRANLPHFDFGTANTVVVGPDHVDNAVQLSDEAGPMKVQQGWRPK